MGYVRKTVDEYHIVYDYGNGDGPEVLCAEGNLKNAKRRRAEYIENENIYPTIHRVRIRKEDALYHVCADKAR